MFVCGDCGCIFEEPDEWQEDRGEYFGKPCSETMSGCPRCGGNYHPYHEVEREDIVTDNMRLEQMLKNWNKQRKGANNH